MHEEELTAEEIENVVRAFVRAGIKKVRLTGGEPLMRKDIVDIARRIKDIKGIETLALTTNGVMFEEKAEALKTAGVEYINISLDTLDREKYQELTGKDALEKVLSSIQKAIETGFSGIKINVVPVRDINDKEAEKLINLAKDYPLDVRFIELMPFSEEGENEKLIVTQDEILGRFPFLKPEKAEEGSAAQYYTAEGFKGKIGMISSITHKFCSRCSRMRLLSDGKIKPCLGQNLIFDARPVINDSDKLYELVKKAIIAKPEGHSFSEEKNIHGLNLIGG